MPNPHPKPIPREALSRGGRRKLETKTAEERSQLAVRANIKRWYKPKDETQAQIEDMLKGLALAAARALSEQNDDRYIRAMAAMGPYLRMKYWMEKESGKAATPISEIDQAGIEAAKQFEEGAKAAEEMTQDEQGTFHIDKAGITARASVGGGEPKRD